jgi:hypothetical protein
MADARPLDGLFPSLRLHLFPRRSDAAGKQDTLLDAGRRVKRRQLTRVILRATCESDENARFLRLKNVLKRRGYNDLE